MTKQLHKRFSTEEAKIFLKKYLTKTEGEKIPWPRGSY